jgi:sugar lactone lactonase YvrE
LGELWLTRANGQKLKLDSDIKGPAGLAFTPDGQFLFVAQSHSRAGLSYRVLADGTLDSREPLYLFQVRDNDPIDPDDPATGSVAYDIQGHAYAATNSGVQVFDRNGRVITILPLPADQPATVLAFGTVDPDVLYVSTATGTIYKRKLQINGFPASASPIKLPHGGGG